MSASRRRGGYGRHTIAEGSNASSGKSDSSASHASNRSTRRAIASRPRHRGANRNRDTVSEKVDEIRGTSDSSASHSSNRSTRRSLGSRPRHRNIVSEEVDESRGSSVSSASYASDRYYQLDGPYPNNLDNPPQYYYDGISDRDGSSNFKESVAVSQSSSSSSSNRSAPSHSNRDFDRDRRKIKNFRELSKLMFTFIGENETNFMKKFKKFVRSRNLQLSINDIQMWKVTEKSLEFRKLGWNLYHMSLNSLDILTGLERRQLGSMKSVSNRVIFIDIDWTTVMLKHSDKSLAELCSFFCDKYYPGSSSRKFDDLLHAREENFLFFLHFFARLSNSSGTERRRKLAPDYICAYCALVGNHFSDECHIMYTTEMRNHHLSGYCNKCHYGRSCSTVHEIGLQCDRCGETEFDTDMCPCTFHENVVNVRMICVATRGWTLFTIRNLCYVLFQWARNRDNNRAGKWLFIEQNLHYQSRFSARIRKLDLDVMEAEDSLNVE